jgi:hypothetical protein
MLIAAAATTEVRGEPRLAVARKILHPEARPFDREFNDALGSTSLVEVQCVEDLGNVEWRLRRPCGSGGYVN